MASSIDNKNIEKSKIQTILVPRQTRFKKRITPPYDSPSNSIPNDRFQSFGPQNSVPASAKFVKSEYINNIVKLCSNVDCCTQTSKTIIQLAKQDEDFSPDSLSPSPRNEDEDNQKTTKENDLKFQLQSTSAGILDSAFALEGYIDEHNSLTFVRKNQVTEYVDDKNFNNAFSDKSLTQTFLAKKQETRNHTMRYSRSQFLQQTSPLRKFSKEYGNTKSEANHLKSKSYVESFAIGRKPNAYSECVPPRASRFTVKNVKAQNDTHKLVLSQFWSPKDHKVPTESTTDNSTFDGNRDTFDQHGAPIKRALRCRSVNRKSGSFMLPTIASEQRNQGHKVMELQNLVPPPRRGRSLSPNRENVRIDYFAPISDRSEKPQEWKQNMYRKNETNNSISPLSTVPKFEEDILKIDLQSLHVKSSEDTVNNETAYPSSVASTSSSENVIGSALNRIKSQDWSNALKGLAEMTELCRIMDSDLLFPYMITVNQRLLELLRSPRSHVCKTACQIAGHLFETMKDTRRPEFDDIVEVLLNKTADSNRFIRHDANLSLDCMITHIPIYHSIRALCLKGPIHKNSLVRTSTIRLIVCAVVIAGPSMILSGQSYEPTRKRVILHMAKFMDDKNSETRRYGERLFKVLYKEPGFECSLKKYLEKDHIKRIKAAMKLKFEKGRWDDDDF